MLVLRVAAGAIFVSHGYAKLFTDMPGIAGVTGIVAHLGFPFPMFFAYVVSIVEFFGGIGLILGLLTPVIGVFGAIDMLVAFSMVMKFSINRGGLELMLLASMVSFALMGAGRLSLDSKFGIEKMMKGMMKKKM